MIHTMKNIWTKFREVFLPWFTVGMVALSGNWAAEAIPTTLQVWWQTHSLGSFSPARTLSVLFFVGSMVALYWQRNTFFKPRTRYLRNETPAPRKHLVLFLSDLRDNIEYDNGIPKGLILSGDLTADLAAMVAHKESTGQPWPWEMGLRGIRVHIDRLETVTVACSTRTICDVGKFLAILRRYRELDGIACHILHHGGERLAVNFEDFAAETLPGLDFESFDQLSDTLWSYLKRRKFPEEEVMIDFTGGQKVTSVVAAAMTFNRRIRAQYVRTHRPWDAASYDVIHAVFDTGTPG